MNSRGFFDPTLLLALAVLMATGVGIYMYYFPAEGVGLSGYPEPKTPSWCKRNEPMERFAMFVEVDVMDTATAGVQWEGWRPGLKTFEPEIVAVRALEGSWKKIPEWKAQIAKLRVQPTYLAGNILFDEEDVVVWVDAHSGGHKLSSAKVTETISDAEAGAVHTLTFSVEPFTIIDKDCNGRYTKGEVKTYQLIANLQRKDGLLSSKELPYLEVPPGVTEVIG